MVFHKLPRNICFTVCLMLYVLCVVCNVSNLFYFYSFLDFYDIFEKYILKACDMLKISILKFVQLIYLMQLCNASG